MKGNTCVFSHVAFTDYPMTQTPGRRLDCPFQYVRNLYAEFTTDHRTRIAFKGGHIERDLLSHLHIPFLDLETLGCPKYNVVRQDEEEEEEETCG